MRHSSASPSRRTAGFTMIELVMVLVLVAILATLAAPAMGSYVNLHKTRRALDQVASDVALARMLAVREGRVSQLVFGQEGQAGSYELRTGAGGSKMVRLGQEYRGIVVVAPEQPLSFDSRGLLRIGPGQSEEQRITASLGSATASLTITLTGRVQRDF